MLSEIEKEEFLRSKTHRGSPDLVLESDLCDLPVDEHVLPGLDLYLIILVSWMIKSCGNSMLVYI